MAGLDDSEKAAKAPPSAGGPDFRSPLPSVSLPKGGGALHGMGEKFAANPATGAGTMSVPLVTSPGRSGFGPQLSLTHNSGAGNGPFGFGWGLNPPCIDRRTDNGIPRYQDAEESDIFLFSGAEDLVPALNPDGSRSRDDQTAAGYVINRYRPRIEGLFARIERWTRQDGDVHWRSYSKDNVLTLFGVDATARIADPSDPARVFRWLISETRDTKGNAIVYGYKPEDGAGVDLQAAHQRNRGGLNDPGRKANRYLKTVRYGNRSPILDANGRRPRFLEHSDYDRAAWLFEVVFDYGEHPGPTPTPTELSAWRYRPDPFSTYRPGFELRTTRLCQRMLMFHNFPNEAAVGADCLVRSTDFTYLQPQAPALPGLPVYSFLKSATQTGYRRDGAGYVSRSLPAVTFEYSQPVVQSAVQEVDPANLANLPIGLDGDTYRWADLHGEGASGILTEQGGAWFYKRNLSPGAAATVAFAPVEKVALRPSHSLARGAQLMDVTGDGKLDFVTFETAACGAYRHDEADSWQALQAFESRLERDVRDPNLRFVDLNGDGYADVLITEDDTLIWYPGLAERGFGFARRVFKGIDEEVGPRVVFNDGEQAIYLADLTGDGLSDIVRIRNGAVCYWPNRGYGQFGAKITMDNAPWLDNPDQFDHRRVRLADIDGSGTADLIYLHRNGVRLYFNHSGDGWSGPQTLPVFPQIDDLTAIMPADLMGNGTACLVWSSPRAADGARPMRYVDLMGGLKPYLLTKVSNNLGAETQITYAASTKFYVKDRQAGQPWITRLPFPVQVVERVETRDLISRNLYVVRYAYHHGFFAGGVDREFRGFGMVEQWDSEEIAALFDRDNLPADNLDEASFVSLIHTKTWFHTGVFIGRNQISNYFAGLGQTRSGEYFREPGLDNPAAAALLLPDTVLPAGLSLAEEREACRALKGAMLRQEVYAVDACWNADVPYTVTEQNFTLRLEQMRGPNRHAVFLSAPRETLTYHYERDAADPRIEHGLTLDIDAFGNVLTSAAIAYGRRQPDPDLSTQQDRNKQSQILITYAEHGFTNAIDNPTMFLDNYRAPAPAESRIYELTGLAPDAGVSRFSFDDWTRNGCALIQTAAEIAFEETATGLSAQKRRIDDTRTLYRPDDFGAAGGDAAALLPLGVIETLALAGETYKLAFTPGLLSTVFLRDGQPLLADPQMVLAAAPNDGGGYLASQTLKADGRFPATEPDDEWWLPSGRAFLSPTAGDSPSQERAAAIAHFFTIGRVRDPFHTSAVSTESFVLSDAYDLLPLETRDALDNRVTAGERLASGDVDSTQPGLDYRVLQPWRIMDANRNRAQVAFDCLGFVVGTAVLGKPEETLGDSLTGFTADLSEAEIVDHLANPLTAPETILQQATTRLVYDLFAYSRSVAAVAPPQPAGVYALARETHISDLVDGQTSAIQHHFAYSDGLGREIQKKSQAPPGALTDGGPVQDPRWRCDGWTVFNNKGKPVREYLPFYTATPAFEFGVTVGVSPILFYDPLSRVVATLHPDNSYEKVIFTPWWQEIWDRNDTVLSDPRTDADVAEVTYSYFAALTAAAPAATWETWYVARQGAGADPRDQDSAAKAALHAATPTVSYFDTLGRPFLTFADNGPDPSLPGRHQLLGSRIDLDIRGIAQAVRDAVIDADPRGRVVARYASDVLGRRLAELSMDTAERWSLPDAANKALRTWDSRGHDTKTSFDPLRRPIRIFTLGADPRRPEVELLTERMVYGEQHPSAVTLNLRGKAYLHFDQAGSAGTEAADFKNNTLSASRRIALNYQTALDWTAVDAAVPNAATTGFSPPALEAAALAQMESAAYLSATAYDALNRSILVTTPHKPTAPANQLRYSFDLGAHMTRVEVNLRDESAGGQLVWTPYVTAIDYDPQGRRQRIAYGSGVTTIYTYDPLSLRLTGLTTARNSSKFPCDAPHPPPMGWPGSKVQDLSYTYDPVGNVTWISDTAQQAVYFRNRYVEPRNVYTYDPIYRLIAATGREHLGQIGGSPIPHSFSDAPRVGIDWSHNDGRVLGTYTETLDYDSVGNLKRMVHRGDDPANPGWARVYDYGEPSAIDDTVSGNRLTRSSLDGGTTWDTYSLTGDGYDAHGNMLQMPNLPTMAWDFRNQLSHVSLGGGGDAFYVYGASGERIRKIWVKSAALSVERLYLGDFEIYREFAGAPSAADPSLERETLHVVDDRQRIALVESRTANPANNDPAPARLVRYQFANHLGSASLELDEFAQIISYEEYSPFGSTTYQAVRAGLQAPKRYRYTGKERDEESGLTYHSSRYFAAWLARWTSADPQGLRDGPSLYVYCNNRPTVLRDPSGTEGTPAPTGLIGNNPRIGALWEQAAVDTLGKRYGATNYQSVLEGFATRLNQAIANKGLGSNKIEGSGIKYARDTYKQVRAKFKELAAAEDISLSGKEIHHAFEEIGENPAGALRTSNLQITNGKAAVLGSGHNFAHLVADAQKAGIENPGKYVHDQLVAQGVHPDVPELSPSITHPDVPAAAPAHAASSPAPAAAATEAPTVAAAEAPAEAVARPSFLRSVANQFPRASKVVSTAGTYASFAVSIVGAHEESNRTVELERKLGRGEFNAQLIGTIVGVGAIPLGLVDDAFAGFETATTFAPNLTMDSWDRYGSGPLQHAAGEAVRGALGWLIAKGL